MKYDNKVWLLNDTNGNISSMINVNTIIEYDQWQQYWPMTTILTNNTSYSSYYHLTYLVTDVTHIKSRWRNRHIPHIHVIKRKHSQQIILHINYIKVLFPHKQFFASLYIKYIEWWYADTDKKCFCYANEVEFKAYWENAKWFAWSV